MFYEDDGLLWALTREPGSYQVYDVNLETQTQQQIYQFKSIDVLPLNMFKFNESYILVQDTERLILVST